MIQRSHTEQTLKGNKKFNSHFTLNFLEEVSEVAGGRGEDDLVRVEGRPAAAGQRHVGEVFSPEDLSGQPAELGPMVVPLQPQVWRIHHDIIGK